METMGNTLTDSWWVFDFPASHVRDFGSVNGNTGHRVVFLTGIAFEGDKHINPLIDLATRDEI